VTWELRLGNCLDPATGLASLADKSVDHVITDPPYEAEAHTKGRRLMDPRKKTIRVAAVSFAQISESERAAVSASVARVARRWQLVFCQFEGAHLWRADLERFDARYVRTMVWVKPNGQPQLTGDRPGVGYECIVVSYGDGGRMRWNGGGKRGWMEFPVDANFSRTPRVHETQKPLPLMEQLVADFTDPGDTVCDPFAGSGTTGVACIRLGRNFIGWEKDPKYHAIAMKRLAAAREQLVLPVKAPKATQGTLL
jgi:site-specific DNA-methyltransferase (adenine-specific)